MRVTAAMLQQVRAAIAEERSRLLWSFTHGGGKDETLQALIRLHDHPGMFIVRQIRKLAGPSWNTLSNAVWLRDEGCCQQCGIQGYAVDHIHERYRGGADCMENLILLCPLCHQLKPVEGWQGRSSFDVFKEVTRPVLEEYGIIV